MTSNAPPSAQAPLAPANVVNTRVARGPNRRLTLALLVLITAVAIVLRLTGIGFLLPHQTEPDGVVFDKQAQIMRDGTEAQKKQALYAFYPHLVPRLAMLLSEPDVDDATPRTLEEHLARARVHRLNLRLLVALLSILAIPATWWLARRFMAETWALASALLLATSVFHIWFAQQARPHAVETSFALLAVLAAIELRRLGTWRAWIFAGLAAGLAIGSLQNGMIVLGSLALAAFLRWRAEKGRMSSRLFGGALLALLLVAACVVFFYPFLFQDSARGGFEKGESFLKVSGHVVDLRIFNGRGFGYMWKALWEYDPLLTALAVLGLALGAVELSARRKSLSRESWDSLWIALVFVVPYVVIFGLYQRTYQRFALPLLPWVCALAGFALWRVWCFGREQNAWVKWVARSCVLFALVVQSYAAWNLVHVRSQRDTISETADWVRNHIDPALHISVLPSVDLPLLQSQVARNANQSVTLDVQFPWFTYLWQLPPGAVQGTVWNLFAMQLSTDAMRAAARADIDAFVGAQHADYVVLEVFANGRRPLLGLLREAVGRHGKLVARISPDEVDAGENLPLLYQDDEFPYTTPWFFRVLHARCVGPIVEIYDMR
jgi:hypothetical protein